MKLITSKNIFLILILFSISKSTFGQERFSKTKSSLSSDLGFTFGYTIGQKLRVKKFSKDYPEIEDKLTKAQILWERKFQSSVDSIKSIFPKSSLSQFISTFELQNKTEVLSKEAVLNYIDEINNRTDGNMESPILETLLTYNPDFNLQPIDEVLSGYIKYYSTSENNLRVKGLHIKTSLPISWNIRQTELEGIVEGFSNENGRGHNSIALIVKDLSKELKSEPNVKLNYELLNNSIYSDANLKGSYMKSLGLLNILEIKRSKTNVSNKETLKLEYKCDRMVLDKKVTIYQCQYTIPIKDKIFILSCTVNKGLNESTQFFNKQIEINKPLFSFIALHTWVE